MLLAYDITANNGAWTIAAAEFADDVWRRTSSVSVTISN